MANIESSIKELIVLKGMILKDAIRYYVIHETQFFFLNTTIYLVINSSFIGYLQLILPD